MKIKAPSHAVMACLLAVAAAAALAQPAPQAEPAAKAPPAPTEQTLWDLYLIGGPLMHFIAAASLGTIAVAAYCIIQINRRKMLPAEVVAQTNKLLSERDVDGAFQFCRANPSPFTTTILAALVKVDFNRDLYNKKAMEETASETIAHEETRYMLWINYLNLFATIAPMLGLLGTVFGMIESFSELAAGRSEPADLAGGIGEAMITTAGGLIVGIPAMFCFFFFRNILQGALTDIEKAVSLCFDLFTGEVSLATAEKSAASPPETPQAPPSP